MGLDLSSPVTGTGPANSGCPDHKPGQPVDCSWPSVPLPAVPIMFEADALHQVGTGLDGFCSFGSSCAGAPAAYGGICLPAIRGDDLSGRYVNAVAHPMVALLQSRRGISTSASGSALFVPAPDPAPWSPQQRPNVETPREGATC